MKSARAALSRVKRRETLPFKRKPVFEALEQRLLLSADVAGNISVPGEVDKYVFTVAEEKQVYFDSQSNVALNWSLAGPRGAVVASRDFRSSDSWEIGGNPVITLTPGEYLLSVDAQG